MAAGIVYLIGAGPGDPKLITVRGLECLRRADAVVYDRLVAPELLQEARPGAELIYAGKAAANHAMAQDEINRLLAARAKEGKAVARLKGGDPFVFGRGGEEAGFLAGQGIRFEVIPGVSSAVAVPAYAGIPVTHRGVASSFAVVTGHAGTAGQVQADTLVLLMGLGNLGAIVQSLLDAGRPPGTPAAVISQGTGPGQHTVTGTLQNIAERAGGLRSPALIVVGEVVKLRETLAWFNEQ
ncbi:MAG TPA: uroporphyrinogen-III C-methyltransferase [Symbiobacteriaceae bacterium]|nr:uroporphyrinogen-III C-methyltransferase [Symbiobacteriaceae bacterium]